MDNPQEVTYITAPNGHRTKIAKGDSVEDVLNDVARLQEALTFVSRQQTQGRGRHRQIITVPPPSLLLTRLRPRHPLSSAQVNQAPTVASSAPQDTVNRKRKAQGSPISKKVKPRRPRGRPRRRDLTNDNMLVANGEVIAPTVSKSNLSDRNSSSVETTYCEEQKDDAEQNFDKTRPLRTTMRMRTGRQRSGRSSTSDPQPGPSTKLKKNTTSRQASSLVEAELSSASGRIPLSVGRVEEGVYLVEGIIDHRIVKRHSRTAMDIVYKVQWLGWPRYESETVSVLTIQYIIISTKAEV